MADVHDKKTRSYNMSRIKGKDTKPELLVRRYLHAHGFRYRLYDKRLPGKPDIVLPKYKTVIFIHGCFWHGHKGCKYFVVPKTRTEWWIEKINKTRMKDEINFKKLIELGYKIFIIWECELSSCKTENTLNKLKETLKAEI
jgi:DNA mismatch endonuclease, patch repair protein